MGFLKEQHLRNTVVELILGIFERMKQHESLKQEAEAFSPRKRRLSFDSSFDCTAKSDFSLMLDNLVAGVAILHPDKRNEDRTLANLHRMQSTLLLVTPFSDDCNVSSVIDAFLKFQPKITVPKMKQASFRKITLMFLDTTLILLTQEKSRERNNVPKVAAKLVRDLLQIDLQMASHVQAGGSVPHWPELLSLAVKVLCWLPATADCPSEKRIKWWRAFLRSSWADTRQTAIQLLPRLFVSISADERRGLVQQLSQMTHERDASLLISLAQICGNLACICSGATNISSSAALSAVRSPVSCSVCAREEELSVEAKNLEPLGVWLPFLEMLREETLSPPIRIAAIHSMPRILRHASPRDLSANASLIRDILELSVDSNGAVRRAFCQEVAVFGEVPLIQVVEEMIGDSFRESDLAEPYGILRTLRRALDTSRDKQIQKDGLMALGSFGTRVPEDRLAQILALLMEGLVSDSADLRATAFQEITHIASVRKQPLREMLEPFQDAILVWASQKLVDCPSLLAEVADGVYDVAPADLLQSSLKTILPELILRNDRAAIEEVARLLAPKKAHLEEMLIAYATDIISHVLMKGSEEQIRSAENLVRHYAKETNFQQLILSCQTPLLNQLIKEMGNEDAQIQALAKRAIGIVFREWQKSEGCETSGSISLEPVSDEHLADYLRTHFLAYMVFMYETLRDKKTSKNFSLQLTILRSFHTLLELLHRYVGELRPKILATLKQIWIFPRLRLPACDVWCTFIKTMSILDVKPILSELVVHLLCYLDVNPSMTQELLEYLIIDHQKELKEEFHNIQFLPELPLLEKCNRVIRDKQASGSHQRRGDEQLVWQLRQLLAGLRHENVHVRGKALDHLTEILQESLRDSALLSWIRLDDTEDSPEHDVTVDLTRMLLHACKDTNKGIRLKCSHSFGLLGAIDADRLGNISFKDSLPSYTKGEDFVSDFLKTHLVRVLQFATTLQNQDLAAAAIQNILFVEGCTHHTPTFSAKNRLKPKQQKGFDLWNKFSPQEKQILTPIVCGPKYGPKVKDAPIREVGSVFSDLAASKGDKYSAWIRQWAFELAYRAIHSRTENYRIFRACLGLIRKDVNVSLYLLPVLVKSLLASETTMDDKEQQKSHLNCIKNEFLAVLKACVGFSTPSHGVGDTSPVNQLCAQAVFSLMDTLSYWVMKERRSSRNTSSTRRSRRAGDATAAAKTGRPLEAVEALLSEIPERDLAIASYRCRAFRRALRHLEAHIRQQMRSVASGKEPVSAEQRLKILRDNLNLMEKIYNSIDEPDGASGVWKLQSYKSVQDRINEYKNAGKWTDALACYEVELQKDRSNAKARLGVLQSLKQLGNFETLLSSIPAARDMTTSRDARRLVNAYGVQAAWRLGRWEELQDFLGSLLPEEDFETFLGKLLLSLYNRDEAAFSKALEEARLVVMGSLSAASRESYHRAYPFIVQLHMLTDIELAFQNMIVAGTSGLSQLVSQWQERIELVLPSFRTREPVLNLQRAILLQYGCSSEASQCSIEMAKLARKEDQFQAAASALIRADEIGGGTSKLEQAKLLWAQGDQMKVSKLSSLCSAFESAR